MSDEAERKPSAANGKKGVNGKERSAASDADADAVTRPGETAVQGAAEFPGELPGELLGELPGEAPGEASGEVMTDQEALIRQDELGRQMDYLAEQVRELQKGMKENQQALLLARADLENARKRAKREVEKAYRYSVEPMVRELLPVIDSMELGVRAIADTDAETLREGMRMTLQGLRKALGRFRVELFEPQPGDAFDPQVHEVVSVLPAQDDKPGKFVLEVLQCGCRLDGRLLRAAKVVVSAPAD